MKRAVLISLCVLTITGALVLSGCGRVEEHGQSLSQAVLTTVREIMAAPERYADRLVKVRGKIVTECPTGCWFEVYDGTGVLYVDTKAAGFAIPQRVGKQVTVEGAISTRQNKTTMEGQGAKIQ